MKCIYNIILLAVVGWDWWRAPIESCDDSWMRILLKNMYWIYYTTGWCFETGHQGKPWYHLDHRVVCLWALWPTFL
ncbi:hypothetical protein Hanom_Chr12g01154671 [Helianthus anomalus]